MKKRGVSSSYREEAVAKIQNALAEERTLLSYIRTEFAFFGGLFLILKFYFGGFSWAIPAMIILVVIALIILIWEVWKIKQIRKARRKLQRKINWQDMFKA